MDVLALLFQVNRYDLFRCCYVWRNTLLSETDGMRFENNQYVCNNIFIKALFALTTKRGNQNTTIFFYYFDNKPL